MSRVFAPSHGVGLLATEILRRPSKREQLIKQALAQRNKMLSPPTVASLVQKLLREPSPVIKLNAEGRPAHMPTPAEVAAMDPEALFAASPRNRWLLALQVATSPSLRSAGIRPEVDVWGAIEKASPDEASRSACANALKAFFRPKK